MAVFSNIDHGFSISGMTTADILLEITFESYSGPVANNRTIFTGQWPGGTGTGVIYQSGGNNLLQGSGSSDRKLDGVSVSSLAPADITGGNVFSAVVTGHGGDLLVANRFSFDEPINCEISAVTVKSADGLTTLHTFDLSSPSSTDVPDTTGAATGTLENFTFSAATITNIDTDNAVNQYQQCNANGVSGLAGPVTSGTLGGQPVTIVGGDWQTNSGVVALGLPGNLATGTYSLVLSDGTNSATLPGVSYTQTHARPAFDGLVDSNSILSGQSYTANTYFKFVTSFSNGTMDTAEGDAAEWAGDIADYYTPNAGFTGDDTASIEFLYSDGTTSATVGVTIPW